MTPIRDAAQSQQTSRSDAAFERWCSATWQTHEARRRHAGFQECWPTASDFHEHWPRLAGALYDEDGRRVDPDDVAGDELGEYTAMGLTFAAADIDLAAAGAVHVREMEFAAVDPPRRPRSDWRALYAGELFDHVGVSLDLASQNPVAAIAKRAKMTPAELDVFRLWAAGDSLNSIARGTGKQLRTVRTLLGRARDRLEHLDRRRFVAPPPTRYAEEPCSPAPETSPQRSSPGSSSMLAAS